MTTDKQLIKNAVKRYNELVNGTETIKRKQGELSQHIVNYHNSLLDRLSQTNHYDSSLRWAIDAAEFDKNIAKCYYEEIAGFFNNFDNQAADITSIEEEYEEDENAIIQTNNLKFIAELLFRNAILDEWIDSVYEWVDISTYGIENSTDERVAEASQLNQHCDDLMDQYNGSKNYIDLSIFRK